MSSKHFHCIVPVWGRQFCEIFTKTCLPFLLSPGNLEAIANVDGSRFVIVTTYADREFLEAEESVALLKKIIPVEYHLVDGFADFGSSHRAMSACYARAMTSPSVVSGETCFIFLTPDSIWSEGAFRRLKELIGQGYCAVMAMGLRTELENISPILQNKISQSTTGGVGIAVDELVALALSNLHSMSKAHNWVSGNRFLNAWPSHLYWWDKKDSLIAHCFHMHPLAVLSKPGKTDIGDTIDGKYLENLNYPADKYYLVQGNEDFLGVELSPSKRNWDLELGYPSIEKVQEFGFWYATPRHWHFFHHRIIYTGPNAVPDIALVRMADEVVFHVENPLRSSTKGLKKILFWLLNGKMSSYAHLYQGIKLRVEQFGLMRHKRNER